MVLRFLRSTTVNSVWKLIWFFSSAPCLLCSLSTAATFSMAWYRLLLTCIRFRHLTLFGFPWWHLRNPRPLRTKPTVFHQFQNRAGTLRGPQGPPTTTLSVSVLVRAQQGPSGPCSALTKNDDSHPDGPPEASWYKYSPNSDAQSSFLSIKNQK